MTQQKQMHPDKERRLETQYRGMIREAGISPRARNMGWMSRSKKVWYAPNWAVTAVKLTASHKLIKVGFTVRRRSRSTVPRPRRVLMLKALHEDVDLRDGLSAAIRIAGFDGGADYLRGLANDLWKARAE